MIHQSLLLNIFGVVMFYSFCHFFFFFWFWCGGFGSFRRLLFLLNYCWDFKNFKLLEKIQKCFAVFADI